jgi:glycopeptide antibiotics resistance protein
MTGSSGSADRWANGTLGLATLAILVCTLFPYEFFLHDTATRRAAPFLLWLDPYPGGVLDLAENILLFIPFGFGWACWTWKKRWRRPWSLATALVAGAALSYTVEFLQVFLPTRDPSCWDVVTNVIGSLMGYSFFERIGSEVLAYASRSEAKAEQFLSTGRIIAAFVLYAALTLAVSAEVQRSTNLSNWQASHAILLGPGMSGQHSRWGRVLRLEITNRAFLPGSAEESASEKGQRDSTNGGASSHGLSGPTAREIAALRWNDSSAIARLSGNEPASSLRLTGQEWQRAPLPVSALVQGIQKTGKFTLRILYVPADAGANVSGRIVSIVDGSEHSALDLDQHGKTLTFAFRTALLGIDQYWNLHLDDASKNPEPQNILITYDGSDLTSCVDGKKGSQSLRLNPGASLVRRLKGVNAYNVGGYAVLYDLFVFAPLGMLVGFGARRRASRKLASRILICTGLLLPPWLQEGVLSSVAGRPFQLENVIIGFSLIIGTFFLLNSDCPD